MVYSRQFPIVQPDTGLDSESLASAERESPWESHCCGSSHKHWTQVKIYRASAHHSPPGCVWVGEVDSAGDMCVCVSLSVCVCVCVSLCGVGWGWWALVSPVSPFLTAATSVYEPE